jgi:pyruvate dehydrogenase E1 component alpha subunit
MPRTVIHQAVTERLEILAPDGSLDEALAPDLGDARLVEAYEAMTRIRLFDDKALKLQRQGRMGTWGSLKGQEAAQVGMALAMEPADWVVPSFREHGLMLLRGVPGHLIYAFWKGDERGAALDPAWRCLPPAVPVGSQHLHAVGLGWALARRGERAAAVACGGDGSTSEGDFHEALNFAGVFQTPTVFFIQNNQWAISVPFRVQTAAASIAQKAVGYGLPGVQVDGNDVLAVYVAAREALERARSGGGPTLIEAHTYRLQDHTTADDAGRYRDAAEVAAWAEKDPLRRLRLLLEARALWDEAREAALLQRLAGEVEAAVAAFEGLPAPEPADVFDHAYAELPWNLAEQRAALLKEVSA